MIAFSAILDGPFRERRWFSVYVMDSAGSITRLSPEVVGHSHRPLWSPDGRYIAFSASQKLLPGQSVVSVADVITGTVHPVTCNTMSNKVVAWLSNTDIAIHEYTQTHTQLSIIDRDGTARRLLCDLSHFASLNWSPARKQFLMTSRSDRTLFHVLDHTGSCA